MSRLDEFYGRAVREFESGNRRDDIWGKAFAQSKGDVQKANGMYVELLALTLAHEAGVPTPLNRAANARRTVLVALKLALSIGGTFIFAGLMGSFTHSDGAFFLFLFLGAAVSWYLLWSSESPLKSKPATAPANDA
ncbi:hypothetical protein [Paraburkholderia guartelaensis]|uniref:Uncharacterized protein n=1 Tax=Paraburkholderia guartelaensis TaxID=2546446 RepID=A0ABU9SNZ5_9BURK